MLTDNLKPTIDLPTWEQLRAVPAINDLGSSMTSDQVRYVYYLEQLPSVQGNFWRYDTITDSWQKLASPPLESVTANPVQIGSLRYAADQGYRGQVVAATSNTITLAGIKGSILSGNKIRITSGLGSGQERTIVSMSETFVADRGSVTSDNVRTRMIDTSKKWKVNQWAGYQCKIVSGLNAGSIRKIVFNSENTLFFQSDSFQLDQFNHAPMQVAFTNASQDYNNLGLNIAPTTYNIESSIATIDSNWDVIPDLSSGFCVLSGGVWFILSSFVSDTTNDFKYFAFYDVLSDIWYNKTPITGYAHNTSVYKPSYNVAPDSILLTPYNSSPSSMYGIINLWEPCFNMSDSGRMVSDSKGGLHLYGGGNGVSSTVDGSRSGLAIYMTYTQWLASLSSVSIPATHTVFLIFSTDLSSNSLAFHFHCGATTQSAVRIYNNSPAGLQCNNASSNTLSVNRLPPYGMFFALSSVNSEIKTSSGFFTTDTSVSGIVTGPVQINGRPGGFMTNMMFYACGIFNRTLSVEELTRIKAYYSGRGVPT